MKIICIEEHAIDLEILKAAQPALQREASYIGLQSLVPRPREPRSVRRAAWPQHGRPTEELAYRSP